MTTKAAATKFAIEVAVDALHKRAEGLTTANVGLPSMRQKDVAKFKEALYDLANKLQIKKKKKKDEDNSESMRPLGEVVEPVPEGGVQGDTGGLKAGDGRTIIGDSAI